MGSGCPDCVRHFSRSLLTADLNSGFFASWKEHTAHSAQSHAGGEHNWLEHGDQKENGFSPRLGAWRGWPVRGPVAGGCCCCCCSRCVWCPGHRSQAGSTATTAVLWSRRRCRFSTYGLWTLFFYTRFRFFIYEIILYTPFFACEVTELIRDAKPRTNTIPAPQRRPRAPA